MEMMMMMLRKIKKVHIPAISRSWILEESPRGDLWDQRCTENHNDHSAMITVQCQWSLYNGHSATFTSYTLYCECKPFSIGHQLSFCFNWLDCNTVFCARGSGAIAPILGLHTYYIVTIITGYMSVPLGVYTLLMKMKTKRDLRRAPPSAFGCSSV